MPGIVVDPTASIEFIGEEEIPFTPESGATYYILTKNGINQTEHKFETWELANEVAQQYNNALDQIDKNPWGVVSQIAP